jgi:PKD repeat protein
MFGEIADGRRLLGRLIALAAAVCAGLLASAANASAAEPAVFDVGAASVNINPDTPQYISGYGYKGGPTTDVHDPLEVRAFVVSNGTDAAAFVVADLTGWFSAYQGDLEPYGITHVRDAAAAELEADGLTAGRGSVIVSSTHTHAAPVATGIWGQTDPAYMQQVSEAAVKAVDKAAAHMQPSEIWTANGNIRSFIWQNGQGTNHPDGFSVDEQLPIMWARDPVSGATNALYANVPNHPDQFNGADNMQFSADWPGYARSALDDLNGGKSVIAAGTLGRQEPPGDVDDYSEVIPQGEFVVNAIQLAMAQASPLTDDTVAGTESHMDTLADNDDLLLGISLWGPTNGACVDAFEICTIPRSNAAPYFDESNDHVGTYVASVRIGDLLYSTNPGEAFPEVNAAIADSVNDARSANVVGMAGDMLGYYYRRSDYTDQEFGSSDFERFNVGPDLAQDNAELGTANAAALGFETSPTQTVFAPHDATIEDKPGLQFYPDQVESSGPTINFYGSSTNSQDGSVTVAGDIEWDFDDGTTDTTASKERFNHTFPGPGSYDVTATVIGSNAKTRSWTQTIVIDPPLKAKAKQIYRSNKKARLSVSGTGGQGTLVSAQWTCQDGTELSGLVVNCPGKGSGKAKVTVADGAGNTATTAVKVVKAPKVEVAKLSVPKKVKAGRSAKVKVGVDSTGGAVAVGTKVCLSVKGKASVRPACQKLGDLKPDTSRAAKVKLKIKNKAKGKLKIKAKVTSKSAAKASATVKTKVKRKKP